MLTIDIGNTTIGLAFFRGNAIVARARLETHLPKRVLRKKLIQVLLRLKHLFGPSEVIICSVVPTALTVVVRAVAFALRVKPMVVGKDVAVPIVNRYRHPKQVGQDRLVGAYAAWKLYGVPAIVIDLGTAITFDVISQKGEYLGGAIVPGIRLSAEALHKKTALLPKIEIRAPKEIIGKDTESSMLSGLFFGYGSLCRGFIELMARKVRGKPKVVMTGGHTRLMQRFIDSRIRIADEDLVYKGLQLLLVLSRRQ